MNNRSNTHTSYIDLDTCSRSVQASSDYENATEALTKILEEMSEEIVVKAVKLAKHAGIKTVEALDIELIVKKL